MTADKRTILAGLAALFVMAPATAQAAPPSNDNFAGRKLVEALPFRDATDTTEATLEASEPKASCGQDGGKTVWYEYRASVSELVQVDTLGSSFDTIISVWTGSSFDTLREINCNNDAGNGDQSIDHFQAAAGTSYLIQVAGYLGRSGELSFGLARSVPGAISGTVRSEFGSPLKNICVQVFSPDLGEPVVGVETNDRGEYLAGGLPEGTYLVKFFDWCDMNLDLETEWFDDRPTRETATPVQVSASNETSRINAVLSRVRLIVSKTGSGRGTVTSNPAGIDCGTDCEEPYGYNTPITLTATPDPSSVFVGWKGCETSTETRCTVTFYQETRTVEARFEPSTNPPSGPSMALQRPHAGAYVNDQRVVNGGSAVVVAGYVTVEVSAADDQGVEEFRFEVNGAPVDPSKVSSHAGVWRFTFRPMEPGEHTIAAHATDGTGITSSMSFQVQGIPAG